MGYFSKDFYYRKGSRWLGYLLMAMAGALIGAFLALAAAPTFYRYQLASPRENQTQQLQQQGTAGIPPIAALPNNTSPVVAVFDRVGPAVVGISNLKGQNLINNPVVSTGSGVIIDPQGYIVTNFHVVEGAGKLMVSLDGDHQYEAKLVGGDSRTDLAVIKIEATNLPPATLGDSTKLRVGELVVAIGNPLGREFARSVTAGVVSALNREITVESSPGQEVTLRVIQTDAPINPGNSGGALVNAQGEVIGINSVKIAAAGIEGMGFAIPSTEAKPIFEQLISKGFISRPFLGIYNYKVVTPELSHYLSLPTGIFAGGVVAGGPAAQAGMQAEDIIIEADGNKIGDFQDLQTVLDRHRPGDRIVITVMRGGQRLDINLTLGEMPRG